MGAEDSWTFKRFQICGMGRARIRRLFGFIVELGCFEELVVDVFWVP